MNTTQPPSGPRHVRSATLAVKAVLVLICLSFVFRPASVSAQSNIFFQASDLADTTPGQDLWSYAYSVSSFSFQSNQGFTVFFDSSFYRQLQNPPPPVNAGWDVLTVQPDLILGDPGFYDAQARSNSPSLADQFSLTFVWLGPGTPGVQPFTIYNTDFSTLFAGQTVAVPEPASLVLLAAGLGAMAMLRRHRTKRIRTRRRNSAGAGLSATERGCPQPQRVRSASDSRSSFVARFARALRLRTAALRSRRGPYCPIRSRGVLLGVVLPCLAFLVFGERAALSQELGVSGYEIVSSTRVGRTQFEFVLRTTVTNSAAGVQAVLGQITSRTTNTVILQSNLTVGNISAASARQSDGTFRIVQNRLEPFDLSALSWKFIPLPAVAVASPAHGLVTNANALVLTGVVLSGSNAPVRVQGGAVEVTAISDGAGHFSVAVPLAANRLNRLFVTATDEIGRNGSPQPVEVTQDSQPPSLFIDFPADGAELFTDTTDVTGRVGDMLSGFLGLSAAVNGQTASVNVGIGNNGSFVRVGVPLALGTNTITATATDISGNVVTRQISVVRRAVVGARLVAASGNAQSAFIHRRLGSPIVVRAENLDGSPRTNQLLNFEVTRSDGRILPVNPLALVGEPITNDITRTPHGVMQFTLRTDANGLASVFWAMGGDAGMGNNRLTVTATNISGDASFCASAQAQPPVQINVGSGNNQRNEAGAPAREPLRAWVSDGCNGAQSVPVTFMVLQGGGKLFPATGGVGGGSNSLTILTTRTGHAEVLYTLGPDTGNNLIAATYPGNPGSPATFVLYGVARDPAKPTTLAGLVLNNSSQPIGHALVEIFLPDAPAPVLLTYTDTQGRFAFNDPPAGPIHLFVYGPSATSVGTNAVPAGSFPFLTYFMTVVPNAENSLPTPVLLPRLNPNNAQTYYGTNDLVVTCEGIAGLKMKITANSMRDVRGLLVSPQNPALVSLNQVHQDKVPMAIPDGAAPPFAWTLQPARATFDPPIQIEYPNMSGLAAGTVAYFLSFNHDTERFEIVASGHVREDSATIVTDPGAGLSVAGWGCNCPPYAVAGNCCNVSISGSDKVAVGQTINLGAGGVPQGGDFQWAVLQGAAFVQLTSLNGTPIAVGGVSSGETELEVTYQPPGVTDPAMWCKKRHKIRVIPDVQFLRTANCYGLDRTVSPPVLILEPNEAKTVKAVIDGGALSQPIIFESTHPNFSSVAPATANPPEQVLTISDHGSLGFEVVAKFGSDEVGRLKVYVLPMRPIRTKFYFVSDRTTSTKRSSADIAAIISHLNAIWKPQANVEFRAAGSQSIFIDANLADGAGIMRADDRTTIVSYADPSADWNLFLVEDWESDNTDPNVDVLASTGGTLTIAQDMIDCGEIWAHEAGHVLLGPEHPPAVDNLMYYSA